MTADKALYDDLLSIYARCGAEVTYETDRGEIKAYWPKRFLQAVKRAEKNDELFPFVSRLVTEDEPSRGFFILKNVNRLDLTVEALICDRSKPYWPEFDSAVLESARQRLATHGFDTLAADDGPPEGDGDDWAGGRDEGVFSAGLRGSDDAAVRLRPDRLGGGRVDRRSGLLTTRFDGVVSGVEVRDQLVALLRANDEIGVSDLLRVERYGFSRDVLRLLQNAGDHLDRDASPESIYRVEAVSRRLLDRRLGSLLAVMEFRPDLLGADLKALAVLAGSRVETRSTAGAWLHGPRWFVFLLASLLGATAVALERPEVVVEMWGHRILFDERRPLPIMRLGGGDELGRALLNSRPNTHVVGSPQLWYPAFALTRLDLLAEHYPETMTTERESVAVEGFLSRAGDYFWLASALAGRDQLQAEVYWAESEVQPLLPQRLADDDALAAKYAHVLGLSPGDVVATLRGWVNTV
ncbi:MAG TPA: hypothetical protein VGG41_10000 [Solirubrobacteraceae bacterium]